MLTTPTNLTKQFPQLPKRAGQGRAIPRALLGYTGPNKKNFLLVTISGVMASVLPEHGEKLTHRRAQVRQDELAAMCSVARETYTRWMSTIATPDDSRTVERRLAQRERAKDLHRRRQHKIHETPNPSKEHLGTLIQRRRVFMRPNRYEPAFRRRPDQDRPRPLLWYPPRAEDRQGNEILSRFFGRLEDAGKGFKHIPPWLWDPALQVSWHARLVMTYYFMCGLGSADGRRGGRLIGVVRPHQATVATALGISIKTVYNANQELQAIGVIRVAHDRIERPDGSWASGPQIIIYLPIRQMTPEEATEERRRLQTMLAVARMTAGPAGPPWMVPRLTELHEQLLKAWTGKEHCLKAFWNTVRRAAVADGIHLRVINSLIPSPPE